MSADNGIYILQTIDSFKNTGRGAWVSTAGKGVVCYRVAHAQAIDNLSWYEENEPYNVGYFLHSVWGNSVPLYDLSEAEKLASEMEKEIGYTEYGIQLIKRLQYNFPW